MSVLADFQIADLCTLGDKPTDWLPMISPFTPKAIRKVDERKVLSYGLSGYGYDVCLDRSFKIFSNINGVVIDPKRFDERCLIEPELRIDEDGSEYVILPPNSYLLGATKEFFVIPNDIIIVAVGKSTYARCGAIVNVTPIEPGFRGQVVIEVSNSTPSPMRIYANEGISQFIFLRGEHPCQVSYADKNGKYQGQTGVTLPRV